jgi:hypothetical protein
VVTGQGKRTPIMVYADHTVQSERTEVLQKSNLIKDFGLHARCTIMKTCCKKRHEKVTAQ